MARTKLKKNSATPREESTNFLERIQTDIQQNNSMLNMVLGTLIVIVLGILVFNYFNKDDGSLGPSQQTETSDMENRDVDKEKLPGKYTVKEGDTLFLIAQKYYDDGEIYPEIAKANKIDNENYIETGLVLEIPKLDDSFTLVSPDPVFLESPTDKEAVGGAENQTIWGERITGENYTVQGGDWLSKIAGRAYGDIMAYEKIAKANNIPDPNLIEPGTVLKIPR